MMPSVAGGVGKGIVWKVEECEGVAMGKACSFNLQLFENYIATFSLQVIL